MPPRIVELTEDLLAEAGSVLVISDTNEIKVYNAADWAIISSYTKMAKPTAVSSSTPPPSNLSVRQNYRWPSTLPELIATRLGSQIINACLSIGRPALSSEIITALNVLNDRPVKEASISSYLHQLKKSGGMFSNLSARKGARGNAFDWYPTEEGIRLYNSKV